MPTGAHPVTKLPPAGKGNHEPRDLEVRVPGRHFRRKQELESRWPAGGWLGMRSDPRTRGWHRARVGSGREGFFRTNLNTMISTEADPLFPPRPTALTQQLLRGLIREGDRVIDATAGNGHDTIFLAECVGETGSVLAFDVQEAAIISARARVARAGYSERVGFFHESHEQLDRHVAEGSVAAVMFNLGYLPGADHELTTEVAATLVALEKSARALQSDGVLSIICYPGHPAGAAEAVAVENWLLARAGAAWRVVKYGALGTRRPAPFLLLAGKGT